MQSSPVVLEDTGSGVPSIPMCSLARGTAPDSQTPGAATWHTLARHLTLLGKRYQKKPESSKEQQQKRQHLTIFHTENRDLLLSRAICNHSCSCMTSGNSGWSLLVGSSFWATFLLFGPINSNCHFSTVLMVIFQEQFLPRHLYSCRALSILLILLVLVSLSVKTVPVSDFKRTHSIYCTTA